MGGEIRSHEDHVAWQQGVDLGVRIYQATASFPNEERFGMTQQVRRAAVSVPSNIAEGFGRGRGPDFARFLRVARGSLCEIETQLLLANRLGYLEKETYDDLRDRTSEAGRVLAGLIRSTHS